MGVFTVISMVLLKLQLHRKCFRYSLFESRRADWLADLNRGACPLLLANEKKPLRGEKSRQLTR